MRFLGLTVVLLLVLAGHGRAGQPSLTPVEARAAVAAGTHVLVDLRSGPEIARTGLPGGARHIAWWRLGGRESFLADVLAAVGHDRHRPLALICAGGVRSARARDLLLANGFTDVTDIPEGVGGSAAGPGWKARGLPLE